MEKSRKMKDITIKEISLVDRPANKRRFLLFKQGGKSYTDSLLKAKKKINIEIASDGTKGGTSITVNGDKIVSMKSFNFSIWTESDEKSSVSCSYSKLVESDGGFQRTESYYLAKGDCPMDERLQKLLKDFFGDSFEKAKFEPDKLDEATIVKLEKALKTVNEYKEEYPADLGAAIGLLAIHASQGYKQPEPVEKAGAKLSKDTAAKIKALVAAAKALESILPKLDGDDGGSTKKGDEDTLELQKTVATLAEAVKAIGGKLEKKEASEQLTQIVDAVAKVSGRVKALEGKPASTKKSIEGDGDGDGNEKPTAKGAGKDGEVLWPSLAVSSDEE